MKLSTKTRYGLRALLDLARQDGTLPVPLREIAERQGLSEAYLEKLLGLLRRKGLVETVRGVQGGYRLATTASNITVAQVLDVLDGPIRFSDCASGGHCRLREACPANSLWTRLQAGVEQVLRETTLEDLINDSFASREGFE
ncbi:Rrf2 family transcriptional regulator [Aminithiophilus ramosus]|uniref:Rrf2 family transcriptional regulator n=2 Tax=Synergistales TaxID=649776 RepID=A0A9Q7EVL9_9BACT|nr:Rrf2 family transcriptional regulator [Aminithiophilus ramosus]QTX32079.1 Rrf2 family transcriptional regulator [Aminithiophilus ramosus]QVL35945.1 Rrf2 family transcriptional regulator [Synergistota bacterium]